MAGNALLPGSEPAAHCYCGHQVILCPHALPVATTALSHAHGYYTAPDLSFPGPVQRADLPCKTDCCSLATLLGSWATAPSSIWARCALLYLLCCEK